MIHSALWLATTVPPIVPDTSFVGSHDISLVVNLAAGLLLGAAALIALFGVGEYAVGKTGNYGALEVAKTAWMTAGVIVLVVATVVPLINFFTGKFGI
jgi:hypothetical protein